MSERCTATFPIVVSARLSYDARCRLHAGHVQMHEGNPWPYGGGLVIWSAGNDPFAYASPWVPAIPPRGVR